MFQYWLQGGHISLGFLGAAQLDRFGNINTTVIGGYDAPKVRLPGGGGAPEIASHCGRVYVTMKHTRKGMVGEVDFITSLGFGRDGQARAQHGLTSEGPSLVITDLCMMRPEQGTNELIVTSLHPGVTRGQVQEHTGWAVRFHDRVEQTPPPTGAELEVLRALHQRTLAAHGVQGDAAP